MRLMELWLIPHLFRSIAQRSESPEFCRHNEPHDDLTIVAARDGV